MEVRVIFSPGHTLASMTYVAGDAAFIHDTLFMPDFGTARCDFPGGDARALWRTIQRILSLPDETRLFSATITCPAAVRRPGKAPLRAKRLQNVHLAQAPGEDEFRRAASGA